MLDGDRMESGRDTADVVIGVLLPLILMPPLRVFFLADLLNAVGFSVDLTHALAIVVVAGAASLGLSGPFVVDTSFNTIGGAFARIVAACVAYLFAMGLLWLAGWPDLAQMVHNAPR